MFTRPRHCSLVWDKYLAVLIFKLKNPFSQHGIRIRCACCMFLCFTSRTLYEYNTFGVIGVGNDPWKLLFSCQLHWAHITFHFGKMTEWYFACCCAAACWRVRFCCCRYLICLWSVRIHSLAGCFSASSVSFASMGSVAAYPWFSSNGE